MPTMKIKINERGGGFLAASLTLAGFAVLWFGFPAKLYDVSVTLERSLAGVETGQVSEVRSARLKVRGADSVRRVVPIVDVRVDEQ